MRLSTGNDSLGLEPVTDSVARSGFERRKHRRASLTWTIYLRSGSFERPFLTRTRDISSEGFYCFLDRPLHPGEHIECDIFVPTHNLPDPNDVVYLRCRARALRVEEIEDSAEFGMACRIEEYRVIRDRLPEPVPAPVHDRF